MRFCQAFIAELWRQIGPDTDVPAGDIGVGGREVGYMFGYYKKMAREFTGTFTGKGIDFGGSLIRPEATGYGNCYFLLNMLATRGLDIKGKYIAISGSGNVATYTALKASALGAKIVSMSDSSGSLIAREGFTAEQLDYIFELKTYYRGRLYEVLDKYPDSGLEYLAGERPWRHVKCDIAMPSATQNELDGDDARALLAAGCIAVSEGANMPSTPEAIKEFINAGILYAPGKAANAGGVAVSGLEDGPELTETQLDSRRGRQQTARHHGRYPCQMRRIRPSARRLYQLCQRREYRGLHESGTRYDCTRCIITGFSSLRL